MKGQDLLKVEETNPISWVSNYFPSSLEPEYGHNFPFFRLSLVPTIRKDPRIRFGLNLLKGPVQSFTAFFKEDEANDPLLHETVREQGIQFIYAVKCDDEKATELILSSLNRLWANGLQEMLLALDWGFSVSQVIYKRRDEQIVFDSLEHINPYNVAPLMHPKGNRLVGARIRGFEGHPGGRKLFIPKILWHVHNKDVHHLYGQSRLEWAFVPWHETWVTYGARDIRRTWFLRNSYDGGSMRYPIGKADLGSGMTIDNKELAVQMMSNLRTGGYRVFPDRPNPITNEQQWQYEPPTSNVTPDGLMEYPESLRFEMLEALGIPPEVVESSSDGGFGAATGRKVPMMAYYSTLTPIVNHAINDFCRFVIDYLLIVNLKKKVTYEVSRVLPLKSTPLQSTGGEGGAKKTDPITKVDGNK